MRARALLAALALALALLAYAPALDPARQLAGRDLFHLFYPLGKVVADAARAGHLVPPPRDPTRGLGVALVADPLAWSFYPPRLLHALLDYDLAFKLVLLLHGALAGFGAAMLARAIGARPRAQALAVVGTVLAGPMLSLHRHPNLLAGAAWAPFVVAGLLNAMREKPHAPRRSIALAAGALGLMLLAGGVEIALGLAPVLAIVALGVATGGFVARGRALLLVAAVLGLGGLLAAIQLAPTWAWLPSTLRPGVVSERDAVLWSLPVVRLLALALPIDPGEPGGYGHQAFSESVGLGAIVLVLAVVGALAGDRRARALACGSVFALVLALGAEGHVFTLMRHLPVFDRFRYPEKLILIVAVTVPALAARALERVLRERRVRLLALALLAGATLELALVNARPSRGLLQTVPTAWLHEPPATVAHVGSGRFVADPRAILAGSPVPGESREAQLLRVKAAHRDALLGGLGGLYGLEDASCYGPFAPRQLSDLIHVTGTDLYFAQVACVTAAILPAEGSAATASFPVPGPEHTRSVPLERVPGTGIAVARLAGGARAVVVPRAIAERPEQPERFACPEARVLERDAWHVKVEAEAAGPSVVVLSELYLDGVTATVDGKNVEARFADCALVAVPVEAGKHTVAVEWHVPGLGLGALASLAVLVVLVVLGFAREKKPCVAI